MKPRFTPIGHLTCVTVASTGLLLSSVSYANDAPQAVLEEILVTARKREESYLKTPLSVNAMSSRDIEEAKIESIADIAANTIGLIVNPAFGRQADRPIIRGAASIFTDEELAGYFVDGVYVSGSLQSFDLESVERVEVIKGPQSAVFGRSTFAGAVNYVTKRPESGLHGRFKVDVGQNGHEIYTGTLEGGSETLAVRGTLRHYEYDSQFKNTLAGGPKVGGLESRSANFSTYWTPTDTTDIHWNISYVEDDDDHFPLMVQPQTENNCLPHAFYRFNYYCGTLEADFPVRIGGVFSADDYGLEQERLRTFVQIDQSIGELDLRWTSAYNKLDFLGVFDQSYAGSPLDDWHDRQEKEFEDYSHEILLTGYALDDALTWTLGAYYFSERLDESSSAYASVLKRDVTNKAIMGSVAYDFTDRIQSSLEVRHAKDTIEQISRTPASYFEAKETFDATTFRWTLSMDLGDEHMAYMNIATGTFPGGFNANPDLPDALIPIAEQEMTQYEVGFKGRFNDNLQVIAAAYLLDWSKQAQSQFAYYDRHGQFRQTGIGYRDNKGESEIKGVEVELRWRATQNLQVTAAATWQDATAKKYISTDDRDTGLNGGNADLSGKRIPLTAEWEALGSVTYYGNMVGEWTWRARLDANYQSSRYVRLPNAAKVGDQLVANGNIVFEKDHWAFTVYGKNLTNEDSAVSALRYLDTMNTYGTAFAITPRREREFGVTVAYQF